MKITYDIRGEFGKEINEIFTYYLIKNLPNTFVLGHDGSENSYKVYNWIKKIGKKLNKTIYPLGKITTPFSTYASYYFNELSVMITASHLEDEFTGFKISEKGIVWEKERYLDLIKKIEFDMRTNENKKEIKEIINSENYEENEKNNFFDELLQNYKKNWLNIREKSEITKKININLEKNHCSLKILNHIFKEVHLDKKSEISFDRDGDRFYLFENNEKLFPDLIGIVFSKYLTKKGDKIIFNVGCSTLIYEELKDRELEMIRTGRNFVMHAMQDAQFGFEYSGHYYFSENDYKMDDGIKALIEFLKIGKEKFLKEYKTLLQKTNISKEYRINGKIDKFEELINYFKNNCYRVIDIDGYRFEFGDENKIKGFLLIRQSNTEDIVSLRFEHQDKREFEKLNNFVKQQIEKLS